MFNLKQIGTVCQYHRRRLGYRQIDVAGETGYSSENISAFETGRNDNCKILMWYFEHGLEMEDFYHEKTANR